MWSSKDYWVNAESERNKGLCNSEGTRTLAGVGPDIKIGLFTCEGARTMVNARSDINTELFNSEGTRTRVKLG